MTTANWFDIPGFSLYQVSSDGTVRYRTDLIKKSLQSYRGYILQLLASDTNSPYYHMYSDDKQAKVTVDLDWLLKLTLNRSD